MYPVWLQESEDAFELLKEALPTSLVLALPRDQGKFCLKIDASDVATGAVLSQEQEDGTYCPLGYSSKSFSKVEQHYTTYDKELLRIMRALEEWQNLLVGAQEPFDILMDHQNLIYFKDSQKLMLWQVNWTTKRTSISSSSISVGIPMEGQMHSPVQRGWKRYWLRWEQFCMRGYLSGV
jgi:hypothetical protein